MKKNTLLPITLAAIAACFILVSAAEAQRGNGFRGGRGPHGDPSFAADRDTFHFLLESNDKIEREVKLLDNGVETHTTSADAEVAARLQEHVAAMHSRLEENRPIRLRDPLFAELFRHADKVSMKVENVEDGVRVTETSDDPYTVKLLQAHSCVVSAFVEHGFAEARKNHEVPDADASTVVLSEEQAEELIRLSAELDRVYIPALALTNQQKQKPSEAAIARLIAEAPAIADNAAAVLGHRPERWSTIGDAIEKAQQLVAEGELMEAHETLEPIRDQLLEERKGLALPYPVDLLNEYHVVMEEIVKPATKATPADVNDAYIARLKETAVEASALWARVEQTSFDLPCFGFDAARLAAIDQSIAVERKALGQLQRALRGGDASAILEAGRAIKPPFAKTYTAFGDFPTKKPSGGLGGVGR